jgi:hypothetical protein
MPNRNPILRCGYLLPRLLLLWAILDIGLRFAPARWYPLHVNDFAMITGTHRTNVTYQNAHAYGDLATYGNCTACRQYRPESVHIDSRGFANPDSSRAYDAILVGDSFGLGVQQSAGETLASQISSRTGLSVYNACRVGRAISREDLMALIDELGIANGIVFFELMDRSLSATDSSAEEPKLNRLDRWYKNAEYSPLANISRDIVGRLYDGHFMPNPYTARIVRKLLPGGQTLLFFPEDLERTEPSRTEWWAKYLTVLNKELRQRNFQLIVILLPSKYTVYQALIRDATKTDKSEALKELEEKLHGLPVVNTSPALQQAAADELAHGRLLYWRDDTHWNAEGVRVAAEQLQTQYPGGLPTIPDAARVRAISQKSSDSR